MCRAPLGDMPAVCLLQHQRLDMTRTEGCSTKEQPTGRTHSPSERSPSAPAGESEGEEADIVLRGRGDREQGYQQGAMVVQRHTPLCSCAPDNHKEPQALRGGSSMLWSISRALIQWRGTQAKAGSQEERRTTHQTCAALHYHHAAARTEVPHLLVLSQLCPPIFRR